MVDNAPKLPVGLIELFALKIGESTIVSRRQTHGLAEIEWPRLLQRLDGSFWIVPLELDRGPDRCEFPRIQDRIQGRLSLSLRGLGLRAGNIANARQRKSGRSLHADAVWREVQRIEGMASGFR